MTEPRNLLNVHLAALSLVLLLVSATGARAETPAPGPRVTVITDSSGSALVFDGASNAILGRGFDLDVETVICRKLVKRGCGGAEPAPPSALDTVQILAAQGRLGKIVVIDTGYNDRPEEVGEAVDPLLRALLSAGVEKVIWVTYVERLSEWADSNRLLVAAATRWPQLTLADWNAVALPNDEWFVDQAHLNSLGGRALATFLHPFLVYACGTACAPRPAFCGLARTSRGFAYVRATGIECAAARATLAAIDRGTPLAWSCVANVDPSIERTCRSGDGSIEILVRSPVAVTRVGGVVTIANWSFRLHGLVLQARQDERGWLSLGPAPWCAPEAPLEALEALRLDHTAGGCFRSAA
jgi:hypothetical protein